MTNAKVRQAAKINHIKLWQIADKLGMQDSAFSRMLRYELPVAKQNELISIIDNIAKEAANEE